MTDLFSDAVFSGTLNSKNSNYPSVAEAQDSLVLVSFQISVWSGMSTEQISAEDGTENMKRRRIVPSSLLKGFSDFRSKAKALCLERGEPYLNGYVMRRSEALSVERTLTVWRKEFCRQRDEVFATIYQKLEADRRSGTVPKGCAEDVVCPSVDYVLRRISFEFDTFALAGFNGCRSSLDSFLKGLALRYADELELIRKALSDSYVTDAVLCRLSALKDRVLGWQSYTPRYRECGSILAEALTESFRLKPYCRDRESLLETIDKAYSLLIEASKAPESEPKLEDSAAKASEPKAVHIQTEAKSEKAPIRFETGLAAMLARGRSLYFLT